MGSIVVVRHGQASMGAIDSMGAADYDRLSTLGLAQGEALGAYWAGANPCFDAVVQGPARRHVGTQGQVRTGMLAAGRSWPEASTDAGLDEHDGLALVKTGRAALAQDPEIKARLAGLSRADAGANAGFQVVFEPLMHRWIDGYTAPGLESWAEFRRRVLESFDRLRTAASSGRTVVAFSSVGPIAVMLERAVTGCPHRAFETAWRLRNSSVTTFVSGRGRITLDRYNEVPHLPDPSEHTFR